MRSLWVVAVAAACTSLAPDPVPPARVATFDVTVEGQGDFDPTHILTPGPGIFPR